MAIKPEAERKFLLRRCPRYPGEVRQIEIKQYYTDEKVRYREAYDLVDRTHKFYRTLKTPIVPGVNLEDEIEITRDYFEEQRPQYKRLVAKTRTVVEAGSGLDWEVDKFKTVILVIAEIEVPAIDAELTLPDWLQSELIMEVTGMTEFSNYNLSIPYSP